MEREFLNLFYSTRRTVSMMELTSTKQWRDEPAVDYINRWRSLSLDCKDRLSEVSAVEMCIQGMHFDLEPRGGRRRWLGRAELMMLGFGFLNVSITLSFLNFLL